jgi:hypothetical protein
MVPVWSTGGLRFQKTARTPFVSITLKLMHPLYPNIITSLRLVSQKLSSIPTDRDVSGDLDHICDTIRRFNSPNEFRTIVDSLLEAMDGLNASETLIQLSTPRYPYTPPATPQKKARNCCSKTVNST